MPSGRVATYNGAHVWQRGGHVAFGCIVDDVTASIATWVADGRAGGKAPLRSVTEAVRRDRDTR
jgi:hypothetical protein